MVRSPIQGSSSYVQGGNGNRGSAQSRRCARLREGGGPASCHSLLPAVVVVSTSVINNRESRGVA